MDAKDRIIIRTFNDVVTELRTVASEIGGDHLSNKEAESVIKTISDKTADLIWETAERINDTNKVFGVPNCAIEEYKREKHKRVRDCKNCKHYVLQDVKINYPGYPDSRIFGCELWDCEFERKD